LIINMIWNSFFPQSWWWNEFKFSFHFCCHCNKCCAINFSSWKKCCSSSCFMRELLLFCFESTLFCG
jgi:hypothetical protein